jgi:hypothetical protein
VWGLRLVVYGIAPLVLIPLLGLTGVRGPALAVPFGMSFAVVVAGVVLTWSAAGPLARLQREHLGGLGRLSRSATVRGMVLRDAFAPR